MLKSTSSVKYQRLLKWLKTARLEKQVSMRTLGAKLKVPHSFVGKVESGERRLDVYEYVQYCKALGLKPEKGIELLKP